MSCLISDVVYYGCADMPEADGVTVGGAINFNSRIEFNATALSPTTQFQVVSSSASDTATKVQISYRDATGLTQTPAAATLTGQSKVALTTIAAERLLAGVTSGGAIAGLANPGGTAAVGDVAVIATTLTISGHTMQAGSANATSAAPAVANLQSGDGATAQIGMVLRTTGGTGANQIRRILAVNPNSLGANYVAVNRNWTTLPDATTTYEVGYGMVFELTGSSQGVALTGTSTQCTAITRMFIGATGNAVGPNINFYDKFFINNNNLSTALTNAQVLIQSVSPVLPGTDAWQIALCNAFNDAGTVANRQTAPSTGITAFTTGAPPQGVNVPSVNLPVSAGAGSAASAQGVWNNLLAVAATPAWEGLPDIRLSAAST